MGRKASMSSANLCGAPWEEITARPPKGPKNKIPQFDKVFKMNQMIELYKLKNSFEFKVASSETRDLTLVIPTYNEADNLPRLFQSLFNLNIPSLKVLVVDDNSPDGTGKRAESLSEKYSGRISVLHRPGKLGLGTAYIQGFKQALEDGAEAVGQMDADFSHPPRTVAEMLKALEFNDVVIGSRYIKGGRVDERWPRWRKGLSAFGNHYARAILKIPVQDVTGGFRVWRREVLSNLPLDEIRSNGYSFQVEMAYLAYLAGYRFKEIPIYFADRQWGQSKMSFRIQLEAALRVLQMKITY
jgi:dolichol-phosphate mannosyltransferase